MSIVSKAFAGGNEEVTQNWFPNSLPEETRSQGNDSGPDRSGEYEQEQEATAKRLFPNTLKDETEERSLEESVEGGPKPSLEIKTVTGETKVKYNGGYHSLRDYAENSATAEFYLADLQGQDLSKLTIGSKDFSHANMVDANLSESKMRGVDLRGADLRNADLRGTDLRNAVFDENTRFNEGTKFENTNVDGADLSAVGTLSLKQMKGMKNLHLAKGK